MGKNKMITRSFKIYTKKGSKDYIKCYIQTAGSWKMPMYRGFYLIPSIKLTFSGYCVNKDLHPGIGFKWLCLSAFIQFNFWEDREATRNWHREMNSKITFQENG